MGAVDRAAEDAVAGRTRLARRRLRSHLVERSDDLAARALLAELYRADGHRDEAGRWGWFGEADATEMAAYEHQCAHRGAPGWTATSVLKGLRWTMSVDDAPPHVREALEDLVAGRPRSAHAGSVRRTPSGHSSNGSASLGGTDPSVTSLADAMFAEVVTDGQSARTVRDEVRAAEIREALRSRGLEAGVRLRTARMGDVVVVARLDAAIWTDDTATMRAKLAPPS